ncbi:hypothetical protein F511_29910 [Dorcoceras hygrometricum]|uniref:Electron transporter n=1 Tax=Dorcoceras hygrometricum TaxID=472368 RepID=A0A2Z7D2F0_9LAMI|nr:hypothetical protein F511_29910 [Dorcoceras hygrometricum]
MSLERLSGGRCPEMVRHKRSKSFPNSREPEQDMQDPSADAVRGSKFNMGCSDDCTDRKKGQIPSADIQYSLKQELEKRLHDQITVRGALEKALGCGTSSEDVSDETAVPKPATELIRDIAILELEVGHLEQYLLSLYRKAFDPKISSFSPSKEHEELKPPLSPPRRGRLDFSRSDITSARVKFLPQTEIPTLSNSRKEINGSTEEKFNDLSVLRSHSSVYQYSSLENQNSPPAETLGKALRACHSQPSSMTEYAQNTSSQVISLAEHLGTRISDNLIETPNKLSEHMVKCMSIIYSKLADPPSTNHGLSSPTSSLSSMSAFSPKDQCDFWSPGLRNDSSFDVRLDNPFHVEGLKDFSGPYSTMVEVKCLHRYGQKLGDTESLLQNFRSLISRLETIDPRKLAHEEKLAFWINVHNALAFLAFGIPQTTIKRMLLLLKAAYNVGGQIVSADFIQNSILSCRVSRPGQWFRLLLSSRTKFKVGDARQKYAIEQPEPLLHFALSSGSHSDPAVRIYTPKRVFQELEAAKEEYIRATFGVRKDKKIILPKIVQSFSRDSGLCAAGIMEMIQHALPESMRKSVKKRQPRNSLDNIIKWAPHNFAFRYLISNELVK